MGIYNATHILKDIQNTAVLLNHYIYICSCYNNIYIYMYVLLIYRYRDTARSAFVHFCKAGKPHVNHFRMFVIMFVMNVL